MKAFATSRRIAVAALIVLLVIWASPSLAGRGGSPGGGWGSGHSGGGWHGGHRGGHFHHGGGGVFIGTGPWWWGPPYYPPPYWFDQPVFFGEPIEYIQPSPPYWYYCEDPPGYYPYVPQCTTPWRPIPSIPAP
jgi:hypothetical protein